MTPKRLLLIQNDPLLAALYRDQLDLAGYLVESVATGDAALNAMQQRVPDLVVIDAVTPKTEAAVVIRTLREQEATKELPIVVLPTSRVPLAEVAQKAGATKVLPRTANIPAELLDAVQTAFGQDRTTTFTRSSPFEPETAWMHNGLAEAPNAVNGLRHALHGALRDTHNQAAVREVFQLVHNLAENLFLLGQRPLFHYAAALEALVFDLVRFPEQSNPSTLRTISQAIDYLSTLLESETREKLRDPGSAQVLVVDDEDGARKIIMAAMSLVSLKSVAADTPSAALAALNTQAFDLIFLDVGLPEMNGFDLCTRVRMIGLHEKTPIVFITGMTTFQNRVQSSLSGGNDFVGKPFNLPELGLKALTWVFRGQLGQI